MKNVTLDFRTGSLTDYGHNTSVNLHERNPLAIDRSLHENSSKYGCLGVENDDWELNLFIKNAGTARGMAEKLTEIANHIEDNQ